MPVMMGSGINCQGFKVLLQAIDKYFPSPDHFECIGVDVSTGEALYCQVQRRRNPVRKSI